MATTPQEVAPSDEQLALIIARRRPADRTWQAARDACEELYARHAGKLLAFLSARVRRSDLEDTHQVIWERVWHYLPQRFHGGNFRAWLFQIARNYLIDQGRRPRGEELADEDELSDRRQAPPGEALEERERQAVLRRCLERLDAGAAELVTARLAGESYADVCRRLGLKPEQAHRLFHRAKEQLQTCVERALS